MKAHQRIIREKKSKEKPLLLFSDKPDFVDIKKAKIKRINYKTAEKIILEYEWLGTMGQCMFAYGIFFENICAGVVCFGLPSSPIAGNICGEKYNDIAICLERGACVYWAHPHSASKLISYACKDLAKNTKYKIFYAYSDESAGEIGTVYQSCNWYCLGKMPSGGSQIKMINLEGKLLSSRHLIKYAKQIDKTINRTNEARDLLLKYGWKIKRTQPKIKYVWFEGTKKEKNSFINSLKYDIQPYPKRSNAM